MGTETPPGMVTLVDLAHSQMSAPWAAPAQAMASASGVSANGPQWRNVVFLVFISDSLAN
jgi:hypothetical protein